MFSTQTNKKSSSSILRQVVIFITILIFSLAIHLTGQGQSKNQMVRLAKIKVDPAQLEKYNTALKEQMATAIKLEPGVLTYYAVSDKKDPSNITILEIYADTTAYQSHILTDHFKRYKEIVKEMVTSLELVDVNLIGYSKKTGL
jgi:quinol monooxygenase YgiN